MLSVYMLNVDILNDDMPGVILLSVSAAKLTGESIATKVMSYLTPSSSQESGYWHRDGHFRI
jgi:hypothetical protein